MKYRKKRKIIRIDPEQYRRFKIAAAKQDRKIYEIIYEALEEWLKKNE